MKTKAGILAIVSAALLVGVSIVPVQALSLGGVSVGGGSNGSTTASASQGDTTASATLGGGTNLASAGVGTGETGLNVGIGGGSGPLITTASSGGTTSANVNLGLDGLGLSSVGSTVNGVTDTLGTTLGSADLGDVTGGLGGAAGGLGGAAGGLGGAAGGIGGDGVGIQVAAQFANYSGGQQQQLKVQCRSILSSPGSFDQNLVSLCRMIAQIH